MPDSVAERIAALPPEALSLLWRWLQSGATAADGAIVPRQRGPFAPLSFAQTRLWFVEQLNPDSPAYNLSLVLPMTGDLDVGILQRVVSELVRRHEPLRTAFVVSGGVPMQHVAPAAEVNVEVVAARAEDAHGLIAERIARPFHLDRPPLFRVHVIATEGPRYIVINMHHIVSDGWSLVILMRELSTLYQTFAEGAPSPLLPLPIQYADYAMWQRDWMTGETLEGLLAFWRSQLAGAPPLADLPLDRPRRAIDSRRGASFGILIPRKIGERVERIARNHGATAFMALLAAFHGVLSRWCAHEKVVVGTPVANRTRTEIEPLIGFFVNMLPLVADTRGDPSFAKLLRRVRDTTIAAYDNQDIPFEKLVDELALRRSLGSDPLVQVVFALENPPERDTHDGEAGPSADPTPVPLTAKFDLSVSLRQAAGAIAGRIEYRTDLFEHQSVERLLRRYVAALDAITRDDALPLSQWPDVLDDERRLIELVRRGKRDRPLHKQLGFNRGTRLAFAGKSTLTGHLKAAVKAAGATIVDTRASHLVTTPGALARLRPMDAPDVREIFVIGAPCLGRTLRPWLGKARVHMLWGKGAWGVALHAVVSDGWRSVVGAPLDGVRIQVTDRQGNARPTGAWGALEISTPATRERTGDHFTRTREIARLRADGMIEWRGTASRMIAPNGTPADPLLLEELLRQHSAVAEAAAVPLGLSDLVTIVEPMPGRTLVPADIVDLVRAELADLASQRVILATIPRLANGQIDRDALKSIAAAASAGEEEETAPATAVEAVLVRIWSEVLQVPRIGIRTNFFDAGGNSITSVQVIARVRESFRVELPLHRLFELPTVEELARAIEAEAPAFDSSPAVRENGRSAFGLDLRQLDPLDVPDFVESLDDWEVQMLLNECLSEGVAP
jgi:acyl carrier protein